MLLFNDYWTIEPPKCYLYEKGIDLLDPFLPVLREVAENGPFLFVSTSLLNLLEVAPKQSHLDLIVAAGKAWLTTYPDSKVFWIDYSIARRLCSLINAIFTIEPQLFGPDQPLRNDIDTLLACLVRLGVPEANRLEETLRLRM